MRSPPPTGPSAWRRWSEVAERVWTVRDALEWTCAYFERERVEAPRRSAEWLLSAATGLSRVELYAYFERPLSEEERSELREGVKRRAAGEPLQYVTGEMPFRHIVLRVVPGVFIPRPETEVLVDEVIAEAAEVERPIVVDLCTGSGCIACSIAFEDSSARVFATDLSELAVETARLNAERLGLGGRVSVACGDLFAGVPEELRGSVDVVVTNPPYIPTADLAGLPDEVARYEPGLALDGGPDGLATARRIGDEARAWLAPGGVLAMELDESCVGSAAEGLEEWYQEVRVVKDLVQRDRVILARGPRL
jgi:release factor glutamine methyltransferase